MSLLDHVVILFLIFWETLIWFSTVTAPTYILTNSARRFPFSTSLLTLVFAVFLIIAIVTVVRWSSIIVLIALPWWFMMLNIFSCICWPFVYLLWKNGYSRLLPTSWLVCFSAVPVLAYSEYYTLVRYVACSIFFHSIGCHYNLMIFFYWLFILF